MRFYALRACPVAVSLLKMICSAFHKVQWRHFSGVVDRFRNTYVEFLPDSVYQKLFRSVYFKRSYPRNKNIATFWTQCSIRSLFKPFHRQYQFQHTRLPVTLAEESLATIWQLNYRVLHFTIPVQTLLICTYSYLLRCGFREAAKSCWSDLHDHPKSWMLELEFHSKLTIIDFLLAYHCIAMSWRFQDIIYEIWKPSRDSFRVIYCACWSWSICVQKLMWIISSILKTDSDWSTVSCSAPFLLSISIFVFFSFFFFSGFSFRFCAGD